MDTFPIEPRGLFSLAEAAHFGFGQRHDTHFDGVMRLAVCLDGYHQQVGGRGGRTAAAPTAGWTTPPTCSQR